MSDVYFLLFEQGTWRKDSLKLLFWTNIKALSKINKERQSDWVKMLWKTKVKRKVIEMHLEIQEANNILENILENMKNVGMKFKISQNSNILEGMQNIAIIEEKIKELEERE